MLTLYRFPAPWDVCSASPFAAKLEAFLNWQNIPHRIVTVMSLKKAPKGKIPFIVDENGTLGDSNFIIEYLAKKHRLTFDAALTDEQKAQARALRYLCEESLYWAMVYFRWRDEGGWQVMKETFLTRFPAYLQPAAKILIQRRVRTMLKMQGTGRHTRDEIAAIACADLDALAAWLGNKPYIFGDEVTLSDLVVFSTLSQFIQQPIDNPIKRHLLASANLVAHADRVRKHCFPAISASSQAAA